MVLQRLKAGFTLARRSGVALRDHPELAVFPVIAGMASLALLGVLWTSLLSQDSDLVTLVGLFAYYVATTFISSFCMAALMYCSRQTFRDETPQIGSGFRAASRNAGPLLVWSVVAAIIGVVLRVLEGNDPVFTGVAAAVFSVSWSVMSFFVVPILVFEDVDAIEMFSRSKDTVVETWGESMGAVGGVTLVTVALVTFGIIVGVLSLWLIPEHSGALGLLVLVVCVLIALLVGQTLTGITKTALYLYATEDEVPSYFQDIDFANDGTSLAGI